MEEVENQLWSVWMVERWPPEGKSSLKSKLEFGDVNIPSIKEMFRIYLGDWVDLSLDISYSPFRKLAI